MLSVKANEELTQVSAGTPMGGPHAPLLASHRRDGGTRRTPH